MQALAKLMYELPGVLQESTCQGEHTYLHAQQLLSHLSRSPNGSIFRRMSEDLESHAARTHGGAVWRLQPSFETRSRQAHFILISQGLRHTYPSSDSVFNGVCT